MPRARRKEVTVARLERVTMIADGFDRNRTYTREEICLRFGYDPSAKMRRKVKQNAARFFRDHFLRRGLPAWPIGKTYMVSGEAIFVWIAANALRITDIGNS